MIVLDRGLVSGCTMVRVAAQPAVLAGLESGVLAAKRTTLSETDAGAEAAAHLPSRPTAHSADFILVAFCELWLALKTPHACEPPPHYPCLAAAAFPTDHRFGSTQAAQRRLESL